MFINIVYINTEAIVDKENKEMLHRTELKYYLTIDELTLPAKKREELLLKRKLIDQGILREMDLSANSDAIREAAEKNIEVGAVCRLLCTSDSAAKLLITYMILLVILEPLLINFNIVIGVIMGIGLLIFPFFFDSWRVKYCKNKCHLD